ncbi:MAG: aminotransferase class I/II-fold pyridoxal phosphate-dependent enzyme [Phycisphaerales bacterium]
MIRSALQVEQISRVSSTRIRTEQGETLLAFTGCDYLGMSFEPAVRHAVTRWVETSGVSPGASRITTGCSPALLRAEASLSEFVSAESAMLLPGGTLANIAAMEALAAMGVSRIWIDPRSHPSISLAARAAGLERTHQTEADAFAADGTLPAEGEVADIAALLVSAGERPVLIDDCHGIGVVGRFGCGACEGLAPHERLIVTGTGSKALGVPVGFVCGPTSVVRTMLERSIAARCSTAIGEAFANGLAASLAVVRSSPKIRLLQERSAQLRDGLRGIGIRAHEGLTPVQVLQAPSIDVIETSRALRAQGLFAPAVSYPDHGSPPVIRLSVCADHTPADVDRLLQGLRQAISAGRGDSG